MKVILLKDITESGKRGDIINVSDGYARNYLFPRKLAVIADDGALKNLDAAHKLEEKRSEKLIAAANALKASLEGKNVVIEAKSGAGKLYGRITYQDIADAIGSKLGVNVDKRKINLVDPIKQLGDYNVTVKLHKDVSVELKVSVAAA